MKKIFLVLVMAVFSAGVFAQLVDTITSAQALRHRDVRWKLNEIINAHNNLYEDSIDLASVAPVLVDTFLYFSYTVGQTDATDTTLFTYGDTPFIIPWEGSHSLVLTKVKGTVTGSSPDIDIAVLKDVNQYDANPTEVLSADLTVTSTTTGSSTTSFASGTILSGDYVWIRIDQTTAQPTQLTVSFYGYLLP